MRIIVLQIDKSGRDVFDKDYSIAVVRDSVKFFGSNVGQFIKDRILYEYHLKKLGTFDKLRLRLRLHTAIVILIVINAVPRNDAQLELQVCNDYDGHFQEIKQMLFDNLRKIYPLFKLSNIILTKFQKPSLVDDVAKKLHEHDYIGINVVDISLDKLIRIIKK